MVHSGGVLRLFRWFVFWGGFVWVDFLGWFRDGIWGVVSGCFGSGAFGAVVLVFGAAMLGHGFWAALGCVCVRVCFCFAVGFWGLAKFWLVVFCCLKNLRWCSWAGFLWVVGVFGVVRFS